MIRAGGVFVIEMVDVYNTVTPGAETLRYTTREFITDPNDGPPHTSFPPRLKRVPVVEYKIADDGVARGTGEIVLDNHDRSLDGLDKYIFAGRQASLYNAKDLAIAALSQVFNQMKNIHLNRWLMEEAEFADGEVRIKIGTSTVALDKPIRTETFGGTGGVDGDAALAGKLKPSLFGSRVQIGPVLVEAARLMYAVSGPMRVTTAIYPCVPTSDVTQVYIAGNAALVRGANYASVADMLANAPAAGNFRVLRQQDCANAGTFFRLGTAPTNQERVTCDANLGYNAAPPADIESVIFYILNAAQDATGGAGAEIPAAVTAPRVVADASVGVYYDDPTGVTVLDASKVILGQFGAWLVSEQHPYIGSLPDWGIRWLRDPTTTTTGTKSVIVENTPAADPIGECVLTILGDEILKMERVTDEQFRTLPAGRVIANYRPYGVTQTTNLAGALTVAQRDRFGRVYDTYSTAQDATVLTQHPNAKDLVMNTAFVNANAAANFADYYWGPFKTARGLYEITAKMPEHAFPVDVPHGYVGDAPGLIDSALLNASWIFVGDVITVQGYARFGCDVSRKFILVGYRLDYLARQLVAIGWG